MNDAGNDLEALTGNAMQLLQVSDQQLAHAVREDQPLIASLRRDGRALFGPSVRELLSAPARS